MKVLTAKLVAASVHQQKQLAYALVHLDSSGGRGDHQGGDGDGDGDGDDSGNGSSGRRRGASREKHGGVNCKRLVWHAGDNYMELEKNAHLHYEGWKSCLV